MHWHVDFLRDISSKVKAYPVRSPHNIEDNIVLALAEVFPGVIPGFGASDSSQVTHLFYSPSDPFLSEPFQLLLRKFRFSRPHLH